MKEKLQELINPTYNASDYDLTTLLHIRNLLRDNQAQNQFEALYNLVSAEIKRRL